MSLTTKHRNDIDGLRAVAVLAVVLHHLSPGTVPGGYVGVDVFFVISGFLITTIISREISEGRFSFGNFYERRVRRLFPALFAMIGTTLTAGWFVLLPSDYLAACRAALGAIFFSSNVVFWKILVKGYFADDSKLNPLLHTWSLGVEEHFYILFPVLLVFCLRYARAFLVTVILVFAILSFAISTWLLKSHEVAVFFLSPLRAWELLAGALLALHPPTVATSRINRESLAAVGFAAILGACFFYDAKTPFPGPAALAPVLGAVAVIRSGQDGQTLVRRMLEWRPVVYVGLISYSLYLWHWPLLVFFRFAVGMDSAASQLPFLLIGSLLLGSLSYRFIELPFRQRAAFPRNKRVLLAASFSLLFIGSIAGLWSRGFPDRFNAQVQAMDAARAPEIPFVECDSASYPNRKGWCYLGSQGQRPTVLLWGDSHLLAWAPALNLLLTEQHKSAVLAVRSACPPLLGLENTESPGCLVASRNVQQYLHAHRGIDSVVLSGYWEKYFETPSPFQGEASGRQASKPAGARAMRRTLQWLDSEGVKIYVLGDVPTYEQSVPLALALQLASGRQRLVPKTIWVHQVEQARFIKMVRAGSTANVRLVDPSEWMCTPVCAVASRKSPFYRDQHHLSVTGALWYSKLLGESLGITLPVSIERPPLQITKGVVQ